MTYALRGAACATLDPLEADAVFFPGKRHGRPLLAGDPSTRAAVQLCATCIARYDCALMALEAEQDTPSAHRFGIFGGLTPTERARLARQRRTTPP